MRRIAAAGRLAVFVCVAATLCNAQRSKTIGCGPDRIYRDERSDIYGQMGQEFCEHVLPGSFRVKDGAFRFWLSRNLLGSEGTFSEGREIGTWKECDRSHRCEEKTYPVIYPEESQRSAFKPELPISYVDGKYIFDFASCRITWITQTEGEKPTLELHLSANPSTGCRIAYIPMFKPGSNAVDYLCTVPFSVGTRVMKSLDLRRELPDLGLPQYCGNTGSKIAAQNLISLESFSGAGGTQIFTVHFPNANPAADISQATLQFQSTPTSTVNRCVVRYDRTNEKLYLLDDAGRKYLGPIAPDGDKSLWNSRCIISGCSREVSGDDLIVQFGIRFNSYFAGPHRIFLDTIDDQGHASEPLSAGDWIVPSTPRGALSPAWPSEMICPSVVPRN